MAVNLTSMDDPVEKRGPVAKGEKGWPINPLGIVVLLVFVLLVGLLVAKPLLNKSGNESVKSPIDGEITSPKAGAIVQDPTLPMELKIDDSSKVTKVVFWVKTYVDNKWEIVGEDDSAPYQIDWEIPQIYRGKAVAVTTNVLTKDGATVKDPGGWREGIIILPQ